MLCAPVIVRKNKPESTNSTTLVEHEQQNQTVNWSGQFSSTRDRSDLATIQRGYGNQAALRMLRTEKGRSPSINPTQGGVLQRKCTCGNGPGTGGTCAECQKKQGRSLQTKLRISEPGNRYEQEADRIADQVMQMPEPFLHRQVEPEAKEEEMVQPKSIPKSTSLNSDQSFSEVSPIVHKVINSPGQPLDSKTLTLMESRFGYNFSQVRVHVDGASADSARALRARAFTSGGDIVFGSGEYAPTTSEGKRLLAHELVHVVQQGGVVGSTLWRVPTRSGIPEGRYSFSSNCGWIDWSHAVPVLVNTLIIKVRNASNALRGAGSSPPSGTGDLSTPTMTSSFPHIGVVLSSASLSVRLLRPLSADEVFAVALSLFKKLSVVFETQQQWTDLIGSSSFAQEDLPSNLIGFYRAVRGYSRADIGRFCGELSTDASLAEYDRDHDFERNRSFSPVGISGTWPAELSTIDDSQAIALYDIRSISAVQGTDSFQFCPMYRIEGTIGETDLFIFSLGGARFTTADNVRVVPTYRFRPGTHGAYGHTTFVEVEPNGQADYAAFTRQGISSPVFVPHNILVCLSSQGKTVYSQP
ncbi:eCIS core domain-containing protein [Nostoc sp.]|uniref:eCIS core domain-containing protein n=1 Tax=Nostoc sp. TaxID=1180 RepID=UPI002FF6AC15